MQRNHGVFSAVVALALGVAASGTLMAGADSATAYTVGDLAVRLAHDLRADLSGAGAEVASAALVSAGVTISGDLTRELREKDVAQILNQLGLQLATSKPDRTVNGARLDRLLDLVLVIPVTEQAGGVSSSDRGSTPPGGGFGRSRGHASPHER